MEPLELKCYRWRWGTYMDKTWRNEERGTLPLQIYDQCGAQGIQVKGGSVARLPPIHTSHVTSCQVWNKHSHSALHYRKDGLSAYDSISLQATVVSLSPQAPGQKTRSRSILAERNSHINDDCQMPTWLSVSYYQMRLKWVSYRAVTNPEGCATGVFACVWVCICV